MSDNVKISIIIPTLNIGEHIHVTLNSLLNQTFKEFEVIFVDGGSTDDTIEVINNILTNAPFKWKVIIAEKAEVSTARNIGIMKSKGDYIFFLDGDDYISPECLELAYKQITSNDADIVFFGYAVVREGAYLEDYTSKFSYPHCPLTGIDTIKRILQKRMMIWTHSALYKKQLITSNNIKFPEGISRGEDFEFIIKSLFHADKVTCIRKTLVYYVLRKGSLSHRYSIKDFEWIAAKKRVYYYLKNNNAPLEILDLLWNVDIPSMLVGILRKACIATLTNNLSRDVFIKILNNPEIQSMLKRTSIRKTRTFSTYLLSRIFTHPKILLPLYSQYLKIRRVVS